MDYFLRICQSSISRITCIISLMLLVSCGHQEKKIKLPVVHGKSWWFDVADNYSQINRRGEVKVHPFFDLVPFIKKSPDGIMTNFVLTTPAKSQNLYDLNLVSGNIYRKKHLCEQDDVWKSYDGDIERPPFNEGFIPRFLDQLGEPQRILVFGNSKFLEKSVGTPSVAQRVKIVGGIWEQYCSHWPCGKRLGKWKSRLVLVGINPEDKRFKKVSNISELKNKVDWQYTKAYLQNYRGRSWTADKSSPAYRYLYEMKPLEAFKSALNKGHFFKFSAIKKLRSTCHGLYDSLWSKALDLKKGKLSLKTFLTNFVDSDFERFSTCAKFVKSSSVTEDSRRHWFFSTLGALSRLIDLGYYYDCKRELWLSVESYRQVGSKELFKKYLLRCEQSEVSELYRRVPEILANNYLSDKAFYYYLRYDMGLGASHEKIYDWIYHNGKYLSCDGEKQKPELNLFPENVPWSPLELLK